MKTNLKIIVGTIVTLGIGTIITDEIKKFLNNNHALRIIEEKRKEIYKLKVEAYACLYTIKDLLKRDIEISDRYILTDSMFHLMEDMIKFNSDLADLKSKYSNITTRFNKSATREIEEQLKLIMADLNACVIVTKNHTNEISDKIKKTKEG